MFVLSLVIIILAIKITNNGFTNSIGWNFIGSIGKSNQRLDPLISTPITRVKKSKTTEIKNK